MEFLFSFEGLTALTTLTLLEIVLGIDNIIFVSILVGRLPENRQATARTIGLSLALILRLVFLFFATWIAGLVEPLFTIGPFMGMLAGGLDVSWRDVIMLSGGLFLLYKATTELHTKLEGDAESSGPQTLANSFGVMIFQIVVLDIVFSIDSVITAIGLSNNLLIMSIAVIAAVIVMQLSAGAITRFIAKHPTVKILALAFLLMVGMVLIADGFHAHIPRGYVYFAMTFSIAVELLNFRLRTKTSRNPVELR